MRTFRVIVSNLDGESRWLRDAAGKVVLFPSLAEAQREARHRPADYAKGEVGFHAIVWGEE